jgi:disulfide bond formation protein DsbB
MIGERCPSSKPPSGDSVSNQVEIANKAFLLLTLVADAVIVLAVIIGVFGFFAAPVRRIRDSMIAAIGPEARRLAFAVAATCTLGSLYYSEVAHYVPCRLCWFQRITMYPLVVILGVGAWKRAPFTRLTALPFIICGLGVSTWHFLVERFPTIEGTSCGTEIKCSVPWFTEMGFVSLAFMCLSGMALIATLLLVDRAYERTTSEENA